MENNNKKMNQIVETAKRLFTDYGYKRVTMDEIAKGSGVVKNTIYQYFKDKDDLLKYFITQEISKMKDIVEEIENTSKTTFEMLHNTIYELLIYRKNQKFLITIAKEAKSLQTNSTCESIKMIDESIINYIEEKIKLGIKKNVVRNCNTKVTAFALFEVYVALAFKWEEENEPLNEQEISENLSIFLKTGLII